MKTEYGDACELVAFVNLIGEAAARYVFHWGDHSVAQYRLLRDHPPVAEGAAELMLENLAAQDAADGFALLDAMRDGGWASGHLPPLVRMAVASLRDDGMSWPAIGERLGVSRDKARVMAGRFVGYRAARASKVGLGLGFAG